VFLVRFETVYLRGRELFDSNFSATDGFAGKTAETTCLVGDNAVAIGMYGKVAAQLSAFAGALGKANLANDNLADGSFLAARQLNAESLTIAVASIFGSTTCFDV